MSGQGNRPTQMMPGHRTGHPGGGQQKRFDAPRPQQSPHAPGAQVTVSYFDNGHIRERLFRHEAVDAAERLEGVDPTQIRRYFGAVEQLRRRMRSQEMAAEELLAMLALIQMRAIYSAARDQKNKPLAEFIARHVKAIAREADPVRAFREGFFRHFEAVIGFHKALKAGLPVKELV